MSRLRTLRGQLNALRRARRFVRWSIGGASLLLALVWVLVAIFALDYAFQAFGASLNEVQRAILLVLGALVVGLSFHFFTRPLLGVRESQIDVALMVERRQEIDSDLVAALQFESPDAARWGSSQLEGAVIEYVANLGSGLDVFAGFSRSQMARRAGAATVSAALVVGLALLFPQHAQVFFQRLLLGAQHYPTRTEIQQVAINGRTLLKYDLPGVRPEATQCAQGRPLVFAVRCAQRSGDAPQAGTARVSPVSLAQHRDVELRLLSLDERRVQLEAARDRIEQAIADPESAWDVATSDEVATLLALDAPAAARPLADSLPEASALAAARDVLSEVLSSWPGSAAETAIYVGSVDRMIEPVEYKLVVGDAWTDPSLVDMIPLPIVETRLVATPPNYAAVEVPDAADASSRQISVLEGSQVDVAIECTNKKRLTDAWLIARTKDGQTRYSLKQQDSDGFRWALGSEETPFTQITDEVHFEIQVIDSDGLHLESPLRGFVRLKADRPPGAVASTVLRVVLPAARPVINYRVTDDYGIARLLLHAQIERERPELHAEGSSSTDSLGDRAADDNTPASSAADSASSQSLSAASSDEGNVEPATPDERHTFALLAPGQMLRRDGLPHDGAYSLDLSPMNLVKGDRIKLYLEAVDYRGDRPGATFLSDPLVLEVSDPSGVYAAILEADERTEQRLTDINKLELGIGETP